MKIDVEDYLIDCWCEINGGGPVTKEQLDEMDRCASRIGITLTRIGDICFIDRTSTYGGTMQNDTTTPQGEESNFEERTSFAAYLLRDHKLKKMLSCPQCGCEDKTVCEYMGCSKEHDLSEE